MWPLQLSEAASSPDFIVHHKYHLFRHFKYVDEYVCRHSLMGMWHFPIVETKISGCVTQCEIMRTCTPLRILRDFKNNPVRACMQWIIWSLKESQGVSIVIIFTMSSVTKTERGIVHLIKRYRQKDWHQQTNSEWVTQPFKSRVRAKIQGLHWVQCSFS